MYDWKFAEQQASCQADDLAYRFELAHLDRGASWGIAGKDVRPLWHLTSVDRRPLPQLHEFYARQPDLVAEYPQTSGNHFGVHLQQNLFKVKSWTALSVVVTVQTHLLDCHPMVDLHVSGQVIARLGAALLPPELLPPPSAPKTLSQIAAPIQLLDNRGAWVSVMLPARDWPFTGYRTGPREIVLRLFSEFLEKGVIRKARLWFVHHPTQPTCDRLIDLYRSLSEIPLPLTA